MHLLHLSSASLLPLIATQFWVNNILNLLSIDGNVYVVAVRVHLNQLEVMAIKIPIQEVIIELKHPQVCQLIHHSDLEWLTARDSGFQLSSSYACQSSSRSLKYTLHSTLFTIFSSFV